jgi:hypothetical protein
MHLLTLTLAAAAASDTEQTAHLLTAIKAVSSGSNSMYSLGLTVIGATIAAIISTSYLRPAPKRIRLIYLLFLPGWVLIGASIFFGDKIARRNIAAHFARSTQQLVPITEGMNADYLWQRDLMAAGLGALGIWLALYLLWWIFGRSPVADKGDSA